jgi:hypothetical protein
LDKEEQAGPVDLIHFRLNGFSHMPVLVAGHNQLGHTCSIANLAIFIIQVPAQLCSYGQAHPGV